MLSSDNTSKEIDVMSEKAPQTLANHARFDPAYHFFALPVIALTVIAAMVHLVQHPSWFNGWIVLFVIAVATLALKARFYALKVQDRIIRLEERERLAGLLVDPLRSRIRELTEGQLVALRFACDTEVSSLTQETLSKNLSKADIKKSIKSWRPDYFRV
jgi:hypothetical protein